MVETEVVDLGKLSEQVSYIRTYLGFNPNLTKNGNGLLGRMCVLESNQENFKKDIECKSASFSSLVIARLDKQDRLMRAYYRKLFDEIENIKRTNISFHTFNNIGTFILKVSAVVTALYGTLKLLGWV
ncbi:hypothetical protein [Borrelia sp. P9F1]|uniref:hypothetical protein n=1 Tax=Borrelia sp. P9F1 TaxID=3058374 RepID=UPI00264821BA|nr:hypothetical protein [Borrelia sp. P9F1]WKC58579.1 hypothetical protein QYZ68_05100 [Borrelia sp. P9F1]WKC58653.1 hypothetical protein QYZ68_05475 [Borrelia sp. P9F1]